jgi:hypothetical protein
VWKPVLRKSATAFGADGECQVSESGTGMVSKWWMRRSERSNCAGGINRKFTPNQIVRLFYKFSAIFLQCRHLRFIGAV